jgi:hypothetical protein
MVNCSLDGEQLHENQQTFDQVVADTRSTEQPTPLQGPL